jgi:hypothetical protein
MKIICDNQEEYDNFVKAMKYLHDFDFQSKKKKAEGIDVDSHPIISTLYHFYLSGKDFPNKSKFLTIKEEIK